MAKKIEKIISSLWILDVQKNIKDNSIKNKKIQRNSIENSVYLWRLMLWSQKFRKLQRIKQKTIFLVWIISFYIFLENFEKVSNIIIVFGLKYS